MSGFNNRESSKTTFISPCSTISSEYRFIEKSETVNSKIDLIPENEIQPPKKEIPQVSIESTQLSTQPTVRSEIPQNNTKNLISLFSN